jgi:hypothetical protein
VEKAQKPAQEVEAAEEKLTQAPVQADISSSSASREREMPKPVVAEKSEANLAGALATVGSIALNFVAPEAKAAKDSH